MNRSTAAFLLAITTSLCLATPAMADKSYYEYFDERVPDPGDPPENTARFRLIVGGLFLTAGAIASGIVILRQRAVGKSSLPTLVVVTIVGLVALAVTNHLATPSQEYQQWQQEHDAWKRGDTVRHKVLIQSGRNDVPQESEQDD